MTTQLTWDASLLEQQPGGYCSTKVGLPAGLYRVSLPVYATQADAAAQTNPLRTLTADFALSSATTVVEIVNSATDLDGGPGGAGSGGSGGSATGGAGGSATGGSTGSSGGTDGGGDGSQASCRTDKIEFSQQTGCANDGSVEFCLPAGDAAALAEVLAVDSTITCTQGSTGRVGCQPATEQLCLLPMLPPQCPTEGPMPDALWQTVCQLAALDVVAKIAPTLYE